MRAPGSMVQKRPMAAGPTIWSMSPIATPSPSQMFSFRRTPGMFRRDAAVERVAVRLAELVEVPDVLPVLVLRHAVGEDPAARLEQPREELLGEVVRLAVRHLAQAVGLQHVDAGVDGVAEDLAPAGLLQEALDPALLVGDDDAELERVLDALHRQRGDGLALAVEGDQRAEVDVGEGVAADHEERLVQEVLGLLDRAGGAERRVLDGVLEPHAQLRAVAEVGADRLRQVGHRHDDVLDAVLPQQLDDVLDARLAGDRHHRLGLVRREGTQTRSLPSCHHDALDGPSPPRAARTARGTVIR